MNQRQVAGPAPGEGAGLPVIPPAAEVPPPARGGSGEEDRIRSGLLRRVREAAAGHRRLPGEFELAAELGCTRVQLRQGLADLERQQVLRRRQGAATVVDQLGLRLNVRLEEQVEHADLLSRLGYKVQVEVLAQQSAAPLSGHVADLLGVPPRTPAVSVRKRWLADGVPAMTAEDILLLPPGMTSAPEGSLFDAAARLWGEPVIWEVTTPNAVAADGELGGLLSLDPGSPLLVFETVGLGSRGRRIFYALEHHRPDLVSYSVVRTVRPPWSTL
jgi:DNA-binding GntR family transcriptional regulator